jgi:hypothetical protein
MGGKFGWALHPAPGLGLLVGCWQIGSIERCIVDSSGRQDSTFRSLASRKSANDGLTDSFSHAAGRTELRPSRFRAARLIVETSERAG